MTWGDLKINPIYKVLIVWWKGRDHVVARWYLRSSFLEICSALMILHLENWKCRLKRSGNFWKYWLENLEKSGNLHMPKSWQPWLQISFSFLESELSMTNSRLIIAIFSPSAHYDLNSVFKDMNSIICFFYVLNKRIHQIYAFYEPLHFSGNFLLRTDMDHCMSGRESSYTKHQIGLVCILVCILWYVLRM